MIGKKCAVDRCRKQNRCGGYCRAHAREYAPEAWAAQRAHTNAYRSKPDVLAREHAVNLSDEQLAKRNARGRRKAKNMREHPLRGANWRERKRNAYWDNRDACIERQRLIETGISAALADDMRAEQGGCCAICPRVLVVGVGSEFEVRDHTELLNGEVVRSGTKGALKIPRGLLCGACNSSLGYYEHFQRPAGLRIEQYETYIAHSTHNKLAQQPKKKVG